MNKIVCFLVMFLLMNCTPPPDQYLPEEVTRRHPGEDDVIRLIDSREGPQLIQTINLEVTVQEILDSGYSLAERIERRTRTFDLVSHGRRIKADIVLYQTGDGSDDERPHRLVTPGSSIKDVPMEMKPVRISDDYAEKAAFLIKN